MRSFLRQPLLHFCVLGGLFYAWVHFAAPVADDDARTILVDRDVLLTLIQRRTQIFDPAYAAAKLDAMTQQERALLIQDYVEEEALFREAEQLGLGEQDYVIRRRMVQKMDYAASSLGEPLALTDAQVEAFYAANQENYRTPDRLSFDHIFARTQAQTKRVLDQLGTTNPAQLGERFAYGRSFEAVSLVEAAEIFGSAFAQAVWLRDVDETAWQGPIASDHGMHLVRLRMKTTAAQPPLNAVRKAVETDMRYEAQEAARREVLDAIIASYRVRDET